MDVNISSSDIIASLSLVVSFSAVFFAKSSSSKANIIAQENLSLQIGMVELEMRQAIENAKAKVNDIGIIMAPLKAKEEALSIDEEGKITLDSYSKNFNAAVQTLMNTYDDACSKYIDNKVDKARFKKNYKYEIRNLLESKDLKEYFDPLTSKYKPILVVYAEWEETD